jgi:hypothetical protein
MSALLQQMDFDDEREQWAQASAAGLARACADNQPDYTVADAIPSP